jgi:hypothetical protein
VLVAVVVALELALGPPPGVEDAEVDEVVIDVVGVVAALEAACFELPHPTSSSAAPASAEMCAEGLTFRSINADYLAWR